MTGNLDYKLTEPKNVPTSNHSINDWALRFIVISSMVCTFGLSADSATMTRSNSDALQNQISNTPDKSDRGALITELNISAEIKEQLVSRILQFKNELKEGWNGSAGLPMEEQSVANALDAVEATKSEDLIGWTVFPSSNGTILFSPSDNFVAGISIGNEEFSYAAVGNAGQEIKGIEPFSVKSFKLAISLINSFKQT